MAQFEFPPAAVAPAVRHRTVDELQYFVAGEGRMWTDAGSPERTIGAMSYTSGYGLPAEVLFDVERSRRLLSNRWFFAGTRGDVPRPRDWLTFRVFDDEFFLLHGTDGTIRCFVNRCAHQSARVLRGHHGSSSARLVCPNHQWSYSIDSGELAAAALMGPDFMATELARCSGLTELPVREVAGMLFAGLGDHEALADLDRVDELLAPYTDPFGLDRGGYRLAHHHREVVPANWLLVMVNNRECCHCRQNHKGLLKLFDPSSFNGGHSDAYDALFSAAVERWEDAGRAWKEQAFDAHDSVRVARYPLREGWSSTTFDGAPASTRLIGGWEHHDSSTLSMWFNPNAWVHFTSDHIATNWVLPLDGEHCELYSSWIVHEDAVEGEDYDLDHLTEVWEVTNAEDVDLCNSMTQGAKSAWYRPGPFAPDERFCRQFCDWFMRWS